MTRNAEHTPSPQSVVVPDPLWMMHVIGPDDIYPAPDHATAVQWCAYLNSEIAPKVPSVLCVAVPAIWTGTAEEHADGLAEAIKGWAVPTAPAPSSLAGGGKSLGQRAYERMRDHNDNAYRTMNSTIPWEELSEDERRRWGGDATENPRLYGLAVLSPEAPAREGEDANRFRAMVEEKLQVATRADHADALFPMGPEEAAFYHRTRADLLGWVLDMLPSDASSLTPRHEAPAEGAGECADLITDLEALLAAEPVFVVNRPIQRAINALRARSSAPEAREGNQPHCQLCGGTVEGWFCQTCEASFEEVDGLLALKSEATHPAAPSADKLREAAQGVIEWCDLVAQCPDQFPSKRPDDNLRGPAFDDLRVVLAALKAEGA